MGVNNLWQLLMPVGRRINIESLEGKTLAVDVSICTTTPSGRTSTTASLVASMSARAEKRKSLPPSPSVSVLMLPPWLWGAVPDAPPAA